MWSGTRGERLHALEGRQTTSTRMSVPPVMSALGSVRMSAYNMPLSFRQTPASGPRNGSSRLLPPAPAMNNEGYRMGMMPARRRTQARNGIVRTSARKLALQAWALAIICLRLRSWAGAPRRSGPTWPNRLATPGIQAKTPEINTPARIGASLLLSHTCRPGPEGPHVNAGWKDVWRAGTARPGRAAMKQRATNMVPPCSSV